MAPPIACPNADASAPAAASGGSIANVDETDFYRAGDYGILTERCRELLRRNEGLVAPRSWKLNRNLDVGLSMV